jgi:hypothetical protein
MQSTANLSVIGLDLAKSVFQLHIVDPESGEIERRQIKRARLTDFFAKCPSSLVAMEACWSVSTILTARRQLSWPVEAGSEFDCLFG